MSNWSSNPALYSTYYNSSTGQYMNGTNEVSWQQATSGVIAQAGNNAIKYNVNIYDWYKKYSDGHLEYMDTQYKFEKTRKSVFVNESDGGDMSLTSFMCGLEQIPNAFGAIWGSTELLAQYLRKTHHFVQSTGELLGIGTQQAATRFSSFTKVVSNTGKAVGTAGYAISLLTIGYKYGTGQNVSTADNVGFGISTALIGIAWFTAGTAAAPFVAGVAIIYGVGELRSYLFTGKTLEENIFNP